MRSSMGRYVNSAMITYLSTVVNGSARSRVSIIKVAIRARVARVAIVNNRSGIALDVRDASRPPPPKLSSGVAYAPSDVASGFADFPDARWPAAARAAFGRTRITAALGVTAYVDGVPCRIRFACFLSSPRVINRTLARSAR